MLKITSGLALNLQTPRVASTFDLVSLLDFSRVMGVAVVVAAVEVVLVSIIATLFAFIYNLSVGLTGGVEVVLTDQN